MRLLDEIEKSRSGIGFKTIPSYELELPGDPIQGPLGLMLLFSCSRPALLDVLVVKSRESGASRSTKLGGKIACFHGLQAAWSIHRPRWQSLHIMICCCTALP